MSDQKHSVVITGASRGIGRRIALMFARKTEFSLLLIARTEPGLVETKEMCETKGAATVAIIPCDASDNEAVSKIKLPEGFPKPNILINNAGTFLLKKLRATSPEEFEQQMQANLYTAVNITNRFLDALQTKQRGLIVNICSEGAVTGLKDSGAYSASKHALLGYSRSLRKELMDTNIGVTAINLGQTQSTSWKGSSVDKNLLVDPDDVARLILSLTQLSPRTLVEEMLVRPQHGRVPPM